MIKIVKEYFVNKQNVWISLVNICLSILCILIVCNATYGNKRLTMKIEYGESFSDRVYAQLFYAETENKMNEKDCIKSYFNGNQIEFGLNFNMADYQRNILRIDPTNFKGCFSIRRIIVSDGNEILLTFTGKTFKEYVKVFGDANVQVSGNTLKIEGLTDDCRFVLDSKFNEKIMDKCLNNNLTHFYFAFVIYLIFGILQIILIGKNKKKIKWYNILSVVLSVISLALGSCLIYCEYYLTQNFDDVPLGQLIYHLHTPLDGTNTSSFASVIVTIVVIILISALLVVFGYLGLGLLQKQGTFLNWILLIGVIEMVYAITMVGVHFDAFNYFKYINQETKIYEENYVDGRDIDLVFPEQKRNLIYIFLESMEITYVDKRAGGGMDYNYIPELTTLSLANESFGNNRLMNGAYTVPGATFTMGGLVAQTSGVPINETIVSNDTLNSEWESENNYVPGVWTIGDVLDEQGYNQEFMIGSDGKFAGRSSYFKGHGAYNVFDYYTAIDKKYIDESYREWWGYEDKKLFEYAKREITRLSKKDEPFNFTMLTADTHFTDGYHCDLCEDEYENQYSNVMACSSKQVSNFVEWVQQQDFYDKTTIVISGDHLTMDSYYIECNDASNYDRRTYFTIINGQSINEKPNVTRKYTTLDLYPTTLAALGVQIEGNRLGLGVNLYSGEPTMLEEYGEEYLQVELLKDSKLYRKKILYGGANNKINY